MVSFPQGSPPEHCMCLSSPPYVPHTPHISLFFIWSLKYYLVSSTDHKTSLRRLPHSPVTSTFLGPNIFLSTLFSKILSLCFSLNVTDQVSNPYNTTGNIIVMYTNSRKHNNNNNNNNTRSVLFIVSPSTEALSHINLYTPGHAVASTMHRDTKNRVPYVNWPKCTQ